MNQATVPHCVPGLPIQVLKADVIRGPDAPGTWVADNELLSVGTARDNSVVLTDPTVSRYHLELAAGPDGILVRDLGSTNGTFVGTVRIERGAVPAETVLRVGETHLRAGDGGTLAVEHIEGDRLGGLCGQTPVMRRLMARIGRVAESDSPVLVTGESGTGKELVARALHDLSPRAAEPFVTVDCGALDANLVASELFGHERGAFTGASQQHIGAFERANGGTLFLDELGELPSNLQSTLLGVLERRRLRRVGGKQEIPVDVRVVSATHHDLRTDINAGTFRLDLYYRLAVVVLQMPSLRDHSADIPLLIDLFLRSAGCEKPVEAVIPREILEAMLAYRWPGNVRELRNFVHASLATGEPPVASLGEVAPASDQQPATDLIAAVLDLQYKEARAVLLGQFESRYFRHLLRKTNGNVSQAAREASMNRSHLSDLLQRHGIR